MEDFIWTDWEKYNLNWSQEQQARNHIKSRHIDFLLCDENMNVQGGIELDDDTHNNQNTYKNDEFKNCVYQKTGFRCFRIRVQLYDDIDKEGSMKWVKGYYQMQMNQIVDEIHREHRYCSVQRKRR